LYASLYFSGLVRLAQFYKRIFFKCRTEDQRVITTVGNNHRRHQWALLVMRTNRHRYRSLFRSLKRTGSGRWSKTTIFKWNIIEYTKIYYCSNTIRYLVLGM
jgi:hypothetical protein